MLLCNRVIVRSYGAGQSRNIISCELLMFYFYFVNNTTIEMFYNGEMGFKVSLFKFCDIQNSSQNVHEIHYMKFTIFHIYTIHDIVST